MNKITIGNIFSTEQFNMSKFGCFNNCYILCTMKKKRKKLNMPLVYQLAAHWKKDHRTIKSWFEKEDPMLEHEESKKIIEQYTDKK